MQETILEVNNLKKYFPIRGGVFLRRTGWVYAVDGVSFNVNKEDIFGIVGESGCGKTTTLRLLNRLIEPSEGSVLFQGQDIYKMDPKDLKTLRKKTAMIFQDPYSSLNPRMTAIDIVMEPFVIHGEFNRSEREERARKILERIGLSSEYINRYPHEFSGGQKQRIGIARALAENPEIIFADEPVSSLDVSVRAQVLNLLKDLHKEYNLTFVYVSHNLRVIRHICNKTLVLYLGKPVELGFSKKIYEEPLHPYTQALFSAIPIMDPDVKKERIVLEGNVPTPINPPSGCRFHTRCKKAFARCSAEEPAFIEIEKDHFISCHLFH
jgi:oligopeptide transport system ATP-binding protein